MLSSIAPVAAEGPAVRAERSNATFRPLVMKVDVNASAGGSAYVEFGATKLLATVYGPHEASRGGTEFSATGELNVDVRYAPFAKRPRVERSGAQLEIERRVSATVEQGIRPAIILERYPKSVIDVHILLLEADGSEIAAAVVAAGLALADAGIELYDIPAATTVVGYSSGDAGPAAKSGGPSPSLRVDPTAAEEACALSSTFIATLPSLGLVSHSVHTGQASSSGLLQRIQLAFDGCLTVHDAMRKALVQSEKRRTKAARKVAAEAAAV